MDEIDCDSGNEDVEHTIKGYDVVKDILALVPKRLIKGDSEVTLGMLIDACTNLERIHYYQQKDELRSQRRFPKTFQFFGVNAELIKLSNLLGECIETLATMESTPVMGQLLHAYRTGQRSDMAKSIGGLGTVLNPDYRHPAYHLINLQKAVELIYDEKPRLRRGRQHDKRLDESLSDLVFCWMGLELAAGSTIAKCFPEGRRGGIRFCVDAHLMLQQKAWKPPIAGNWARSTVERAARSLTKSIKEAFETFDGLEPASQWNSLTLESKVGMMIFCRFAGGRYSRSFEIPGERWNAILTEVQRLIRLAKDSG